MCIYYETTDIIMNLAMGMPTPEGADAAMPNLPEAMAGINPRKSQSLSLPEIAETRSK